MSMRRFIFASTILFLTYAAPSLAEVPQVTTDIAPVQSLVARVMQGLGTPGQVVRQGASPHGYAIRPSEARKLENSDAIFWIGPALTPWLERAIANVAPNASVIELLEAPETTVLEFRQGVQFGLADMEGQGGEHDHDHAHDHSGHDPHAWLDPQNAKVWLDLIAAELGRLDADNADTYMANAKAGQAEIDALQAEIQDTLAPVRDLRFVVFHDAYQYFEHRFGLSASGAIAEGDATDPGPARIEAVRQVISDLNITCVFSEPQFNQAFVATAIEGSDAKASIIDPLGFDIAAGPNFYPALLKDVAQRLADCAEADPSPKD